MRSVRSAKRARARCPPASPSATSPRRRSARRALRLPSSSRSRRPGGGRCEVDRRLASLWFGRAIAPQGWEMSPGWEPLAGDYEARDGWIKLHTNAPHHRAAALAVLGVHRGAGGCRRRRARLAGGGAGSRDRRNAAAAPRRCGARRPGPPSAGRRPLRRAADPRRGARAGPGAARPAALSLRIGRSPASASST